MHNTDLIEIVKSQVDIVPKRCWVGYFLEAFSQQRLSTLFVFLFPYEILHHDFLPRICLDLSRWNVFLHGNSNIPKLHCVRCSFIVEDHLISNICDFFEKWNEPKRYLSNKNKTKIMFCFYLPKFWFQQNEPKKWDVVKVQKTIWMLGWVDLLTRWIFLIKIISFKFLRFH